MKWILIFGISKDNMEKIFNLEELLKIEIHNKENANFKWKEYKKYWFCPDRQAAFYSTFYGNDKAYSKEDLEKGAYYGSKLLVEDKKVYYRHYVKLIFANPEANYVKQDFETYEEAKKWGEKIAQPLKRILIIENNKEKKHLDG